jgi:hypothetical protein
MPAPTCSAASAATPPATPKRSGSSRIGNSSDNRISWFSDHTTLSKVLCCPSISRWSNNAGQVTGMTQLASNQSERGGGRNGARTVASAIAAAAAAA